MNSRKNKFWFGVLAIGIPLVMLAQTIRWYNDALIPQKTTIADTDIVSIQQTGPNAYRWAYASTLKSYAGGTPVTNVTTNYVLYGSNYYAGDTYNSNYFETNIFPNYNSSNYFATVVYLTNSMQTNVTIEQYLASDSAVSNYVITQIYQDNSVSNYFETNIFPTTIEYHTNTIGGDYIANLNGVGTNPTLFGSVIIDGAASNTLPYLAWNKAIVSLPNAIGVLSNDGFGQISWVSLPDSITVISNTSITTKTLNVTSNITYVTATGTTNAWSGGPTGDIDLALSEQFYAAAADMEITGVINKSNTVVQNVLLTIMASGSDRTLYIPADFRANGGVSSYVCTNGVPHSIWIRYYPALGTSTNVCDMSFWR